MGHVDLGVVSPKGRPAAATGLRFVLRLPPALVLAVAGLLHLEPGDRAAAAVGRNYSGTGGGGGGAAGIQTHWYGWFTPSP